MSEERGVLGPPQQAVADSPGTATSSQDQSASHGSEGHVCAECAARSVQPPEEFVYAIGRLDVRFPSLGVEREFMQREAALKKQAKNVGRGERIRRVLEQNQHLARRMCYLFMIGGMPAYVVAPTGAHLLVPLSEALTRLGDDGNLCLLIGRRGPMAGPETCGGVMAPVVACDQLYSFSIDDWYASLEPTLAPHAASHKVAEETMRVVTRELFNEVVRSTENLGATYAHRALNYLVMQHPGLFIAAIDRVGTHRLEKIETRITQSLGTRVVVAVILTFLDSTTGVPERLFTRVDVTEQWPFVADTLEGTHAPLGMMPFVENAMHGALF
jgi:hypothetical protein